MALFRDDTGRTEKPTPGRRRESDDRGQVAMSREVTMAATLLVGTIFFVAGGGWLFGSLADALRYGLRANLAEHALGSGEGGELPDAMREIGHVLGVVGPPILALVIVVAAATALAGYGQIGFRIRSNTLRLQFERLNPAGNLGKLFSFTSLIRALVSAGKLAVLAGVLWLVIASYTGEFGLLSHVEPRLAVDTIVGAAFQVLLWIAGIVLLIAFGDLAWQRFDHTRNLMMTRQEVEDERKRTDGDPLIRNRMRSARRELLRQRMIDAVPKADVVITNPTHFAVALAYDRVQDAAPRVVAKGADEVAARMREIAREADVPLMEDPPLARALFRNVKVDETIPERFFAAVATVLGHVYRLKGRVA